MKYITRGVWILSVVSFFTDVASEMLYPVMPVYLKSIGFSIVLIGVLEGLAEAIAGFSKGYFGRLSDAQSKRVPFVQMGYALSAISKPMMAMFIYPVWVFFARAIDRLGKGIRTGARDAMLSDEATPETKGKVFGFHRSMDTLGAVVGPALALLYLNFYPENYKSLFFIAVVPGVIAVLATFYLKDKVSKNICVKSSISFINSLGYWKVSPTIYKKVVAGILIFALFNSSDVFLLMKIKEAGMSDSNVIGMYIFYNLIYAIFAFPLGVLADKFGLKNIFICGLVVFALVYFGMSSATNLTSFAILFFLYGIYAASTEGISKAWISNITAKENTAAAIGTLSGLQSIAALLASSLTGLVWYYCGASTAFIVTSAMALLVAFYFMMLPEPVKK